MKEISRDNPLLFFGCGNMGGAMLEGWIAGGVDPAAFFVVDPMAQSLPPGVAHFVDASQVGSKVGIALAAVKPQIFTQISGQLESVLTDDALLLSVMAGVRIETLLAALPGRTAVRLMPNLAAALGKSPLGLFESSSDAAMRADVENLLSPLGTPVWISEEPLMDAVTALAGSGPAFVYRFVDALAKPGKLWASILRFLPHWPKQWSMVRSIWRSGPTPAPKNWRGASPARGHDGGRPFGSRCRIAAIGDRHAESRARSRHRIVEARMRQRKRPQSNLECGPFSFG